ncbi:MAG: Ig-like domain-containing protein [Longimicrobiales bacterium]
MTSASSESVNNVEDEFTYVSLRPGSLPNALSVQLRNLTAGGPGTSSLPVVNGGFDPIPIAATVNDRLELAIFEDGGSGSLRYMTVPRKRPPAVVRTDPPKGRTDVALNSRPIVVMSEPIDITTVSGVSLLLGGSPVRATTALRSDGVTIEVVPEALLEPNATYTLLVTQSVQDLQGDALEAEVRVEFTTPPPAGPRPIAVGQTVSGRITGTESECRFMTVDGGWGGVCHQFDMAMPSSGSLETTVRWSAGAPLVVFVKTASGAAQIDLTCCGNSPATLVVPVEAGASYRVEVAYAGRPAGYPRINPVNYTLETRLFPAGDERSATLRAILFADLARTQRLSSGRVEILDGPLAGSAAVFDSITGMYDLGGLPRGFAQIRASADGFNAATIKVPVGVSLAQEVVLGRLVPLVGAIHKLGGMMWASANSAYAGVKVEILDGPHAGVFTFSDENFGMYQFEGLSPGLIHVRASKDGLASQTQAVLVNGFTTLHFRW